MSASNALFKLLCAKDPKGTATEYTLTREELEAVYNDAYAEAEKFSEETYAEGYEDGKAEHCVCGL